MKVTLAIVVIMIVTYLVSKLSKKKSSGTKVMSGDFEVTEQAMRKDERKTGKIFINL